MKDICHRLFDKSYWILERKLAGVSVALYEEVKTTETLPVLGIYLVSCSCLQTYVTREQTLKHEKFLYYSVGHIWYKYLFCMENTHSKEPKLQTDLAIIMFIGYDILYLTLRFRDDLTA